MKIKRTIMTPNVIEITIAGVGGRGRCRTRAYIRSMVPVRRKSIIKVAGRIFQEIVRRVEYLGDVDADWEW